MMRLSVMACLLCLTACSARPSLTLPSECVDGAVYDVLEYGKFLRIEHGKHVAC